MIISTLSLCAILTFHESRSASFKDQYYVASTVFNRATTQNKSIDDVVFQHNQYSSMSGFKKRLVFKSYVDMFKYYKIDDVDSYYNALNACSFAQDNDNNLIYFHDNSIKRFKWNLSKPTIATKSFKFYKENNHV